MITLSNTVRSALLIFLGLCSPIELLYRQGYLQHSYNTHTYIGNTVRRFFSDMLVFVCRAVLQARLPVKTRNKSADTNTRSSDGNKKSTLALQP